MVLQVWLDVETYHEVVAMLEIYASLSEKQLCEQGIYSDGEQRGKKNSKNRGGETDGDGMRIQRPICLRYLDDLICFD